jgi:hypothetical protein
MFSGCRIFSQLGLKNHLKKSFGQKVEFLVHVHHQNQHYSQKLRLTNKTYDILAFLDILRETTSGVII